MLILQIYFPAGWKYQQLPLKRSENERTSLAACTRNQYEICVWSSNYFTATWTWYSVPFLLRHFPIDLRHASHRRPSKELLRTRNSSLAKKDNFDPFLVREFKIASITPEGSWSKITRQPLTAKNTSSSPPLAPPPPPCYRRGGMMQ